MRYLGHKFRAMMVKALASEYGDSLTQEQLEAEADKHIPALQGQETPEVCCDTTSNTNQMSTADTKPEAPVPQKEWESPPSPVSNAEVEDEQYVQQPDNVVQSDAVVDNVDQLESNGDFIAPPPPLERLNQEVPPPSPDLLAENIDQTQEENEGPELNPDEDKEEENASQNSPQPSAHSNEDIDSSGTIDLLNDKENEMSRANFIDKYPNEQALEVLENKLAHYPGKARAMVKIEICNAVDKSFDNGDPECKVVQIQRPLPIDDEEHKPERDFNWTLPHRLLYRALEMNSPRATAFVRRYADEQELGLSTPSLLATAHAYFLETGEKPAEFKFDIPFPTMSPYTEYPHDELIRAVLEDASALTCAGKKNV